MRSNRNLFVTLVGVLLVALSQSAYSAMISGLTYSTANGFTDDSGHPVGSHFHSTNFDVPEGSPGFGFPGIAETGGFFGEEEVRGVSEFDLAGQTAVDRAILRFDVLDLSAIEDLGESPGTHGGLFGQDLNGGNIDVFAFSGNNVENIGDYEIALASDEIPLLTFDASQLSAGDTLEADITGLFNQLVTDSAAAFGVRVQMSFEDSSPDAGAITFTNFRIETEVVPEPSSILLLMMALGTWTSFRRK